MLPPLLELYVVWHPDDDAGRAVARQITEHFQGAAYTGLIAGAVAVYHRCAPWDEQGAPRPVPFPGDPWIGGVEPARYVAVLPVLQLGMAAAVQSGATPWHGYLRGLAQRRRADREHIGIYPVAVVPDAVRDTVLGELFGVPQRVDTLGGGGDERRCLDVAQQLAQLVGGPDADRLTVFVSHSRQVAPGDDEMQAAELTRRVREAIHDTHLNIFYDATTIEPGEDWQNRIRREAARCAVLAVRGDRYASRRWCQTEMRLAKCAGVPVVVLDALRRGEERGSFLLDHVPRVPSAGTPGALDDGIRRALTVLVDECLRAALWRRQRELAEAHRPDLAVDWWAAHAPEPTTFLDWLLRRDDPADRKRPVVVLYPDPPLGPDEADVLVQLAGAVGIDGGLDLMTPRQLAARGG